VRSAELERQDSTKIIIYLNGWMAGKMWLSEGAGEIS
jgi:hypothetical protein